MSIYSVPPPSAEPVLPLCSWLVLECTNKKRYLIGYCNPRREGRASTEIVHFDISTMTVRTSSGRVYQLEGAPGLDPDASYTWRRYARANRYIYEREVTAEYWLAWSGLANATGNDNMVETIAAALRASGG